MQPPSNESSNNRVVLTRTIVHIDIMDCNMPMFQHSLIWPELMKELEICLPKKSNDVHMVSMTSSLLMDGSE